MYSSRQPQEGDILLLNSKSLTGIASRAAGASRYSHVGLVIGADLFIDAVSRKGVSVRRVSSLASDYAVDECEVVRSHDLVIRAPGVWSAGLDYLDRPYKLRGVFTKPDGTLDDRDPVVCSKLVAMILQDVDTTIRTPIHSMLPRDFDSGCKGTEWSRFPLSDYDVLANPAGLTKERLDHTRYWLNLVKPLHSINASFKAVMRRSRPKHK